MTSSVVTIRLNGKPYQIGCDAGEEAHVIKLGVEVDAVMQTLIDSMGQIGDARLLAMTALIIADRSSGGVASASDDGGQDTEAVAVALEKATFRLTELATKLTTP